MESFTREVSRLSRFIINTDWWTVALRVHVLVIWAIVVWMAYLVFRPYEVYEFPAHYEIVNENKEVSQGDVVLVRQEFCKLEQLPARIDISMVDGFVEALRTIESNSPVGCFDRVSSSVTIPAYATPGEYKLVYVFNVRVNPIRTDTFRVETETFNVIEAGQ